jgi:hypothetical protein
MAEIKVKLRKLHTKQQLIYDDPARFKIICAGRRFGKTALCIQAILVTMLQEKPKHCMFLALEYDSCKHFFKQIVESLPTSLIESDNKSELKLTLINGSTLTMFSSEACEKIRGREYDLAVIDEAAQVNLSYIFNEIIRPLLGTTKGKAYIISTPYGQNYFYQLWQQALNGSLGSDWSGYHFTSYDNPYFDKEELDGIKANSMSTVWEQEYMANATANASNPFKYEDIVKNIVTQLSTEKAVCYGIDISNGMNDSTVVIGIDKSGVMSYYESWKIQNNYTQQTEKINALPKSVLKVVDSTGSGVAVSEALKNKGHYVLPYLFTGKSKPNLIYKFIQAVESGLVKYTPQVAEEMHVYQMTYTTSNNTQFGNQSGFNDDRVTALALAWFGYSEYISVGSSWKGLSKL